MGQAGTKLLKDGGDLPTKRSDGELKGIPEDDIALVERTVLEWNNLETFGGDASGNCVATNACSSNKGLIDLVIKTHGASSLA
jgi:hypothetical protein